MSVEDLLSILKSHSDKYKIIVCNEIIYFREQHKSQVLYSPELFKVICNTDKERLPKLIRSCCRRCRVLSVFFTKKAYALLLILGASLKEKRKIFW